MIYTEYRESYMYWDKFRIKIVLDASQNNSFPHCRDNAIYGYLKKRYIDKDFRMEGGRLIYLKDDEMYNYFCLKYANRIRYQYFQAPGYENSIRKDFENINGLWYERYPFKIHLKDNSLTRKFLKSEIEPWIKENVEHGWTKNGISRSISFFFVSKLDAIAFKLTFADLVKSSEERAPRLTKKLLKARIESAKKDLEAYVEGLN